MRRLICSMHWCASPCWSPTAHHGRTRYSMLETIRQFAEDQLVDFGFGRTGRTCPCPLLRGPRGRHHGPVGQSRQQEAYAWLFTELANLRTAFRWSADRGDLDAAAAIATLAGFSACGSRPTNPFLGLEEMLEPAVRRATHGSLRCIWSQDVHFAGREDAGTATARRARTELRHGTGEVPCDLGGFSARGCIWPSASPTTGSNGVANSSAKAATCTHAQRPPSCWH